MGRGNLVAVRNWSGEPLGGPGRVREHPESLEWVEGPSGWSRQVWGTSRRSGTGIGTLGEVQTGRKTLKEVQDRSEDPPRGQGRVGGPLGRSGKGWGTLGDVQDGSRDPPGGTGWVKEHSGGL